MKHRSLVAPALLVIVGAVFLVGNLNPELGALRLLADYWPLLLVGWGLLRLVEILLLAARSRPLPRNGVTGGEWALVILICAVGGGADAARDRLPHALITTGGIEVFGEAYDYRAEASQPAEGATRLRVENQTGSVRVVGADTDRVQVQARTTVRALSESEADKANQQCPLEALVQEDQIVVRTNQERHGSGWTISTDLEITVPREFSVQAEGEDGDFDISNIARDVDLTSGEGGVRLAGIGGSARLNLRRSDIVRITGLKGGVNLEGNGRDLELEDIEGLVSVTGSYSGETRLQNMAQPLTFKSSRTELYVERLPGQLRMAPGNLTGNKLAGPVRFKDRASDVRLSDFTGALELDIERSDIELRPIETPLSRMVVRTGSGSIEITLPDGARPTAFLAETEIGEATNEYGPPLETEGGNRGAAIKSAGSGEPSIHLRTERGDVTVRKASGRTPPAPPTPPDPPPSPAVESY